MAINASEELRVKAEAEFKARQLQLTSAYEAELKAATEMYHARLRLVDVFSGDAGVEAVKEALAWAGMIPRKNGAGRHSSATRMLTEKIRAIVEAMPGDNVFVSADIAAELGASSRGVTQRLRALERDGDLRVVGRVLLPNARRESIQWQKVSRA